MSDLRTGGHAENALANPAAEHLDADYRRTLDAYGRAKNATVDALVDAYPTGAYVTFEFERGNTTHTGHARIVGHVWNDVRTLLAENRVRVVVRPSLPQ